MSDTPQGDGWWQTSDGKWHPPEYDPTQPDGGMSAGPQAGEFTASPPPWSPSGGTAAEPGPGTQPEWGSEEPQWGEQTPPPPTPPQAPPPVPPPASEPQGYDQAQAPEPPTAPSAPLFGETGSTPTNPVDDSGPFTTTRPGEFGLPSEVKLPTEPKVVKPSVKPSVIPGGDGPTGNGGAGISPVLLWSGVAAAVLVVLFAGWYLLLRGDGSDEDALSPPEAAVAGETTVSTAEETTTTAVTTTEPLPPKPTIAAGERLPVLEFNGTGSSSVTLDPPGPRVANIEYSGTGPFEVTGLDANDGEVDTFVSTDGPYSGSVAVDFRPEQDSRTLAIEAEGPWSIRMVPVESLTPLPAGFTGTGDNVVLYSGDVGPVKVTHSGSGPFEVNYFEIRTRDIVTMVDEEGPFEGSAELRGPAFVWITADGDWSITPG